ncbi:VOC family protein [Novosphingobium huizhouense]|uniref:VOC family protein n=1 Tax=Novosphingobium huizhouense TaxID=2866625 RepID=UPI001CD8A7DA|nr:VOC family protein [Novosphingobium huizhouense]
MTRLSMTKLVVSDLEASVAFYAAVCGFKETGRFSLGPMTEVIMASADGKGAGLVILTDDTSPGTGECVLVFDTDDLAAFQGRVEANGGKTTTPITKLDQLGISFAMFTDNAGHIVEGIQRG